MAALFHDMGYPICHFLNVRNRISEYNPTLYMFTHNDIESFDHIASLLGSSLLFTIVSPAEIKKAMQFDGKKYNHGAYSAIAFLMQFYNSGIIFSLPEEKQCAIEIAAVAIYNHTVSFRITNNKSTENFYQPVFQQNPIAFLLRLCDDLQEWGRRYFEFSHQSDIPFCSKCFTPSVFHHDDENGMVKYSCLCSMKKRSKNSFNSFRNYQFLNRKLYLVTTSDYMYSDYVDVVMSESDSKMKTALRFKINYDYFKGADANNMLLPGYSSGNVTRCSYAQNGMLYKVETQKGSYEFLKNVHRMVPVKFTSRSGSNLERLATDWYVCSYNYNRDLAERQVQYKGLEFVTLEKYPQYFYDEEHHNWLDRQEDIPTRGYKEVSFQNHVTRVINYY